MTAVCRESQLKDFSARIVGLASNAASLLKVEESRVSGTSLVSIFRIGMVWGIWC